MNTNEHIVKKAKPHKGNVRRISHHNEIPSQKEGFLHSELEPGFRGVTEEKEVLGSSNRLLLSWQLWQDYLRCGMLNGLPNVYNFTNIMGTVFLYATVPEYFIHYTLSMGLKTELCFLAWQLLQTCSIPNIYKIWKISSKQSREIQVPFIFCPCSPNSLEENYFILDFLMEKLKF